MASVETSLQGLVHSLEQGRLARLIRLMVTWASIICLALAYLLIQFRGLSSQTGIDQAQEGIALQERVNQCLVVDIDRHQSAAGRTQ
jgi:hypothetical protein